MFVGVNVFVCVGVLVGVLDGMSVSVEVNSNGVAVSVGEGVGFNFRFCEESEPFGEGNKIGDGVPAVMGMGSFCTTFSFRY